MERTHTRDGRLPQKDKQQADASLIGKLIQFIRPHRRYIVTFAVASLLTAAAALCRPLLFRALIDRGVRRGDTAVIGHFGLLLAVLVATEQALVFAQVYASQIAGARAMTDLRRRVFEKLQELRVSFFDLQPLGRLVTRTTSDVDAINELFASGALNALSDLLRLVGIVVLMLVLDWRLSLITFLALPPVLLLVRWARGHLRPAFHHIRSSTAKLNATMAEQVAGVAVIQAFRQEAAAAREFDTINRSYQAATLSSIKYESVQDAAVELVSAVCLALVISSLGIFDVSFGTIVAFNAYLIQFFEPIGMLAQRYTLLQSALTGAERVFALLAEQAPDAPRVQLTSADEGPARLDVESTPAFGFHAVTFGYNADQPVLRDITFDAGRTEKIAVVGPTGAGKSSLISLLLRFYDPQAGVVRVQGHDARSLPRHTLRRQFATVPQAAFLFPSTVAENIALSSDVDEERVEELLDAMDSLEMFARRKHGLRTRVDEQGLNFSLGEQQVIGFARALYRDAPCVVLDEATANVDSHTEAQLQKSLMTLLEGRAALIIAHRLSTIRSADRVIVMQHGRIVEHGDYASLLAQGGLFARLHALHFGEEVI